MRLFFSLYNLLIFLTTPVYILRLKWKSRLNRAYGERINERFGFYRQELAFQKHDIWVHAVSFGEAEVAKGLITQWLNQGKRVLVTSTTPTGSARIQALFQKKVTHVYLPFEWPSALKRLLKQFQPKLLVIMETELWPNLIRVSNQHNLNIVITNARLSEKSIKGYAYIRPLMRQILSYVTLVIAQTKEDGARFVDLGLLNSKMKVGGNLKFDAEFLPLRQEERQLQRSALFGERAVLIAASTHPGEEALLIESFNILKQKHKALVLVLAPRHPERATEIAQLLDQCQLTYCSRTEKRALAINQSVFILNTLGELQLFYQLADVAFVGGSLVPHGGHNVLEAIRADLPVVVGPHMHNFKFMAEQLLLIDGMVQAKDAAELASMVDLLLSNEVRQAKLKKAAHQFLSQHLGALERHLGLIENTLRVDAH